MAKLSKEQRAYMDGMAFALKITREGGVEALEKEIEFRGLQNVPMNVSSAELIACSREYAKKELYYISTAMASTMTDQLKIPLAKMKEYLREFTNRVKFYRYNNERFEADCTRLSRSLGLNEMCKEYLEEEENE